jgi:hypothetical protein
MFGKYPILNYVCWPEGTLLLLLLSPTATFVLGFADGFAIAIDEAMTATIIAAAIPNLKAFFIA